MLPSVNEKGQAQKEPSWGDQKRLFPKIFVSPYGSILWAWGQIGSSSECLNKGLLTPVHNANVFISSFILPQSTTLTALTQNPSFFRILVDGTQGPALVSHRKGRSRVGHRSCLILDFSKQSFDRGGLSLRHCGRNPCQHFVPWQESHLYVNLQIQNIR